MTRSDNRVRRTWMTVVTAAVAVAVAAVPAQAAAGSSAASPSTASPSASSSGSSATRVGPYLHDHPKVTVPAPRKAAKVSVAAPAAKAGQELTDLRTETTRTYATDTPGEFETKAYAQPVNYRDAAGNWKEIDTTLSKGSDGSYRNGANAFTVKVAPSADASALTDVDLGNGLGVSWSLGAASASSTSPVASPAASSSSTASPSAARPVSSPLTASSAAVAVKDSTATFTSALPHVDLKVSSTATGVKEDLVLDSAAAPSTYTFPLHLSGLTPTLAADGSVALADKTGRVRASIPTGWMADASGAVSPGVTYHLLPAATSGAHAGDPVLQVSLDTAWLADPARSFPVTVDPSLVSNAATDDTYVQSTATSTDFSSASALKVGQSGTSGPVFHSFLHFDVSSLHGMYINWAQISADTTKSTSCTASTVNAYQVTQSWAGSSTRWPGPTSTTQIGSQPASGGASGCASSWMTMRISQAVRRWTTLDPSISAANYGVMLDAASDSDPTQYHEFASADTASAGTAPYLQVSWRNPNLGIQDDYTMDTTSLDDGLSLGVNDANGNVVLSAPDVAVPGKNGTDLDLTRSYNSEEDNTRQGAPGTRWTLSGGQDIRLSVLGLDQSATFEGPSGLRVGFTWNRSTSSYVPPVGINATLTQNSTSTYDYTVTFNDTGLKYRFTTDPSLKTVTDADGNTITYGYDANSRATTVTDTLGGVTKLAYTSAGLLSSITDPFGRATTYAYTGTDLTSSTDPAGKTTSYGYDSAHTLTSITDPRGAVTKLAYDSSGRVSAITWADSTTATPDVTSYAYPTATETKVTDARGNTTTYDFTSDGRATVSTVTDPRGLKQTYAYDSIGDVSQYTNTNGGIGQVGYSGGTHDVGSTAAPTGAATTLSYAATSPQVSFASRPTSVTNSQGITTQNTWASPSQLTQSTTGGVTTKATYQGAGASCPGAIATSTNGLGGVTTYTYDSRCRLITTQPPAPLGKSTQTWDGDDRLASITDGDGRKQVYTYDADDRTTRVDYYAAGATTSTSSDAYTYDANGNQTQEVDVDAGATRTSSYTLDALNRVTGETLPSGASGGGTYANGYGYDVDGDLTSLTTPSGKTTYTYDTMNRPLTMTPPTSPTINFSYFEDTDASVTFPNNVTENKETDKDGRLLAINQYYNNGGTSTSYAQLQYGYTNPATGNDTDEIYSVKDTPRNLTQTYTYDSLGRVSASKGISNGDTFDDHTYAYDADSNRTSWAAFGLPSSATYNTADEMTSRTYNNGTPTSYTYDAAGAQTASSQGDSLTYDARGRTSSTHVYGSATLPMTYTGDGNDDRLASNGRSFTDSSLGITSQTDSTGTTQFLRAPDGTVLGQTGPDGKTWYYLSDNLGSITGLTDSSGNEVNSFGYGPYGEYDYGSDAGGGLGPVVPWKYIGAYRDSDTVSGAALYKLGARYYNPDTGRFTEPDPSGQEVNSYLYAVGDPVDRTDPTGLKSPGSSFRYSVIAAIKLSKDLARRAAISMAKNGDGDEIMNGEINDVRFPRSAGWRKMQGVIRTSHGTYAFHWFYNVVTQAVKQFKMK